jgi:outer membrane protein
MFFSRKKSWLIAWLVLGGSLFLPLRAQETWDLARCVRQALDNSIQLKQAELNLENAALDNRGARQNRLPSVNASASQLLNFGRSIDPTQNTFVQRTVRANSFSVSGSMPIYNGGQISHNIKRTEYAAAAAAEDADELANDLALQVAQAYLSTLLAEESLQALMDQRKQTENQLAQTEKLIRAGTLPANAVLDLEAQLARQDLNIVSGQNAVDLAYLTLAQLMQLPLGTDFRVQQPQMPLPTAPVLPTAKELYDQAEPRQPGIRAGEWREQSARMGVKLAQGAGLPSLNAFVNLQTNYSNLGQRIGGFTTQYDTLLVDIPNTGEVPITFINQVPFLENNPFFSQLDQNFSQQVGVSLSVPIYNQGRVKNNVARAELSVLGAEYATDLQRQQLFAEVSQALLNAKAAWKRFEAAQKSVRAAEMAYSNAEKRYGAGTGNSFELTNAQNVLALANTEAIQAKFEFLFRQKVVEFYQGGLSLSSFSTF